MYKRQAHTTGVKGSIVEASNVFLAILVSSLIFHQEKLDQKKVLGCIVGFAGVVLINLSGSNVDMSFNPVSYTHLDVYKRQFESSWPSYGRVAQVVEHLTFNQVVRGSNPRTLTYLVPWFSVGLKKCGCGGTGRRARLRI